MKRLHYDKNKQYPHPHKKKKNKKNNKNNNHSSNTTNFNSIRAKCDFFIFQGGFNGFVVAVVLVLVVLVLIFCSFLIYKKRLRLNETSPF